MTTHDDAVLTEARHLRIEAQEVCEAAAHIRQEVQEPQQQSIAHRLASRELCTVAKTASS